MIGLMMATFMAPGVCVAAALALRGVSLAVGALRRAAPNLSPARGGNVATA